MLNAYMWACTAIISASLAFVCVIVILEVIRASMQTERRVRLLISQRSTKKRTLNLYWEQFSHELGSSYEHVSFNGGKNLYQKKPYFREDE